MLYLKFLWNPINVIEGEGRWMILVLGIIFAAFLITKGLDLLICTLSKYAKNIYLDIVASSLYSPVICVLWVGAFLASIDLVTDELFSEKYAHGWALIRNFTLLSSFGWFLFRLKNRFIQHAIESRGTAQASPEMFSILALSKILTILIVITLLILFNDMTGMSLTALLAFGGVGGLALAFASQEIISNFFGGFMLHVTRPFIVGERIFLPSNSVDGYIEEIGWYQTRIRAVNTSSVYLPNALFTKAVLVNKSRSISRPLEISLYVEAEDGLQTILEALTQLVQEHPRTDRGQWSGARLDLVGPTSTILVSMLTTAISDKEYYALKDVVTLEAAKIVEAHKGRLVHQPLRLVGASAQTT